MKTEQIFENNKEWNLKVHGWVFDIHSGELIDLEIDFLKILGGIREI